MRSYNYSTNRTILDSIVDIKVHILILQETESQQSKPIKLERVIFESTKRKGIKFIEYVNNPEEKHVEEI